MASSAKLAGAIETLRRSLRVLGRNAFSSHLLNSIRRVRLFPTLNTILPARVRYRNLSADRSGPTRLHHNVRCSSQAIFGSSLRSHFMNSPAAELGRYATPRCRGGRGLNRSAPLSENIASSLKRAVGIATLF